MNCNFMLRIFGIRLLDYCSDEFKVGYAKEKDALQFRNPGLVFRRGKVLLELLQCGAKRLYEFKCSTLSHTSPFFALKQDLDILDALRLILLIIQSNVEYVDEPGSGVTLGVNISTQGHEGVGPDANSSPVTFSHRHSPDGTWDSICMKCYLTVATVLREEDLAGAERSASPERLNRCRDRPRGSRRRTQAHEGRR